jgi:hypothetical protein
MSGPAEIEACHERLHRAGWSIGEVGTTRGWLVTRTNCTPWGLWRLVVEHLGDDELAGGDVGQADFAAVLFSHHWSEDDCA